MVKTFPTANFNSCCIIEGIIQDFNYSTQLSSYRIVTAFDYFIKFNATTITIKMKSYSQEGLSL